MSAELSERERKILLSLVAEYVATGAAVGSRTLSRRYAPELSAATIRNVMADLEHAGLLAQPHASAGRVPTERGLRCFIEALSELPGLSPSDHLRLRHRLAAIYAEGSTGDQECLRHTGRMLSEVAGTAAIVAARQVDTRKLAQLRFIRTGPERLLAVLILSDGMVENRYLDLDWPITEAELDRIHNLLEGIVAGQSLRMLRGQLAHGVEQARGHVDQLSRRAFELGRRALGEPTVGPGQVVIEGHRRLMDLPEYHDATRLRALVHALEDREQLFALVDKTIDAGSVSVYFGSDVDDLAEAQLSLVVAPFHADEETVGTVGVIGPTRMDYARLMPLVGATADALTEAIKRMG